MGREIFLVLLLICSSSRAAFEQSPHGARAVGLGGSTVSVQGDLWSAYLNPSCLPAATTTSVAVEYLPAMYGLWEIQRGAVTVDRGFSFGSAAFSICGLGFALYREITAGVAVSHELNERVIVGLGLHLYSLSIRGYGGDQALGLDIGALVRLAPGVSYGVALHNVNRPSLGSIEEPLPQSVTMGVSVQPLPAALLAISAEKDSRFPFGLSVGAEYCFEELLTLRLGAVHEPSTVAAGIGVRTSLLNLDYAYTVHPDLGGTHCFSVSFVLAWP